MDNVVWAECVMNWINVEVVCFVVGIDEGFDKCEGGCVGK